MNYNSVAPCLGIVNQKKIPQSQRDLFFEKYVYPKLHFIRQGKIETPAQQLAHSPLEQEWGML